MTRGGEGTLVFSHKGRSGSQVESREAGSRGTGVRQLLSLPKGQAAPERPVRGIPHA